MGRDKALLPMAETTLLDVSVVSLQTVYCRTFTCRVAVVGREDHIPDADISEAFSPDAGPLLGL